MKINNVDMEKMGAFMKEAEQDLSKALKTKKVEGHWNFEEGRPQFEAKISFPGGSEIVQSDQAPFMGGSGLKPDPIQYCLFGLAGCYAATFASIASEQGISLKSLKVSAENQVDLSKAMGLNENPIVRNVKLTVEAEHSAEKEKIERIKKLAADRCPGVYCLTNPIPLEVELKS